MIAFNPIYRLVDPNDSKSSLAVWEGQEILATSDKDAMSVVEERIGKLPEIEFVEWACITEI